jgi:hypothetical protein
VRGTLRVTAAQTVLAGAGKHRTRLTRIVVLYGATITGAADAHGRFTGYLRVAYRPATPVTATLTVTVGSTRTATRIVRVTIQAIPLTAGVTPGRVRSGGRLTLTVRTAARAHVMALLQVLTSQEVMRGTGRRGTRVRKVVVLYQVALHGTADGHGRFTGHVRITYQPDRPAQAGLLVTARARAGAASANVRVTIVNDVVT